MTAFTGIPTPDQIGAVLGTLEGMFADPGKLATKENLTSAIDGVKEMLKPAETKNVPEEVEAFRKAFSCYYSGNFSTGFRHGYVQKVVAAARSMPRPRFNPSSKEPS